MTAIMAKVAIVETNVYGALAYHANCLTCGERVCPQAHDKEATAVKHAQEHVCKETP
jgi:hypothetical protein